MGSRTALIYGPEYGEYRFNEEHPLDPLRLRLTVELIEACGLIDERHGLVPPRPATAAATAVAALRVARRSISSLACRPSACGRWSSIPASRRS